MTNTMKASFQHVSWTERIVEKTGPNDVTHAELKNMSQRQHVSLLVGLVKKQRQVMSMRGLVIDLFQIITSMIDGKKSCFSH